MIIRRCANQSLDHHFNHGIKSASRSQLNGFNPNISAYQRLHSVTLINIINEEIGARLNHGNLQSLKTKQSKTSDPISSQSYYGKSAFAPSLTLTSWNFHISLIPAISSNSS